MKFTRLTRITALGAAAGLTLFAFSLITEARQESAPYGRNGRLHIVKDCSTFSGAPGSSFCQIKSSNLRELPVGAKIYYNQITGGPSAGVAGFLDSTIFIYVSDSHWAVGRCTLANDNQSPGLCTISDGVGPLAGLSARIEVTYAGGPLYGWDGRYSVDPTPWR